MKIDLIGATIAMIANCAVNGSLRLHKNKIQWKLFFGIHWRIQKMLMVENERIDLKDFFENASQTPHTFFCFLFSNERSRNRTNEICFYTYDHLLDIFLDIRVSRYEQMKAKQLPKKSKIRQNLINVRSSSSWHIKINLNLTKLMESGWRAEGEHFT